MMNHSDVSFIANLLLVRPTLFISTARTSSSAALVVVVSTSSTSAVSAETVCFFSVFAWHCQELLSLLDCHDLDLLLLWNF